MDMLGEGQKNSARKEAARKLNRVTNINGVTFQDIQVNKQNCYMASVGGVKGTMRPTGFTEDSFFKTLRKKLLRQLH